jgi:hypothetical protein
LQDTHRSWAASSVQNLDAPIRKLYAIFSKLILLPMQNTDKIPTTTTPHPRLPLEPEEYPLYKPPRRFGCSALSITILLLFFMFAFLFWRVTPGIVGGLRQIGGSNPTPLATLGVTDMATQTAEAVPPTDTPAPTFTPVPECVQIVNSSLQLREKPDKSLRGTGLAIGTKLQALEAPTKDDAGNEWRHVQQLPPDTGSGYVLNDFLKSVPCP